MTIAIQCIPRAIPAPTGAIRAAQTNCRISYRWRWAQRTINHTCLYL
jgi:hypothetical protein